MNTKTRLKRNTTDSSKKNNLMDLIIKKIFTLDVEIIP